MKAETGASALQQAASAASAALWCIAGFLRPPGLVFVGF
jgi:hypothetical protein